MPPKKSNLNNACSRDARRIRRKRAERALMLTNQTTVANTAERQGATERRTQEISKHCDKRLWLQGEIESPQYVIKKEIDDTIPDDFGEFSNKDVVIKEEYVDTKVSQNITEVGEELDNKNTNEIDIHFVDVAKLEADSDNAVIKEENIDTDIFLSNEIMRNEQSSETDLVEEKTESDEELYTSNDSENESAGSDWETGLPYRCSRCNVRLTTRSQYMKHFLKRVSIPLGTSTKEYICKLCNQSFKRRINFRRHRCEGTEVKRYYCHQCDKVYRKTGGLFYHQITHTEKRFVCGFCNGAFHFKKSLERHISIHSEESGFKCWICNKGFHTKSSLIQHVECVHPEEDAQLADAPEYVSVKEENCDTSE